MTPKDKTLIVIAGPTAIGKTALAVSLAKHFNTEVLSADSRQFFKEMKIGTARPETAELKDVTHHFLGSHSIEEDYNASGFENDALNKLNTIFMKHPVAILCGGSGLYINAVCNGFDEIPKTTEATRDRLNLLLKEEGVEKLQELLKEKDPDYFNQVDTKNPQRLIRALEVCIDTGQPYSSYRKKKNKDRPFQMVKIALNTDREKLYERINQRVDLMIQNGLIEETKSLTAYKNHNALQTVGYKELFDYFSGKTSRDEAIELIKRNTRRYAKRQLTWLRKESDYHWFEPQNTEEIIAFITKALPK